MILIYLDQQMPIYIANKNTKEITENEQVHLSTPEKITIGENGFFDSLNSKNLNGHNPNSQNEDDKNKILPGTFTTLEDIQTTQTQPEIVQNSEYVTNDEKIICPKMCGAIWGKDGQLIYFNNITLRKTKKEKKMQLAKQKNTMRTLADYNDFLENMGAHNVHTEALHSIRKRVFEQHFDSDDDRFADEFVVGFSLNMHHRHGTKQKSKHV